MNLRSLVNSAIQPVNQDIIANLYKSTGSIENNDGTVTPAYAAPVTALIQVQSLNSATLRHAEFLNIQGTLCTVILTGAWAGLVRADQVGGDKMEFPEYPGGPNRMWLAVNQVESWPGWSRLIMQLQVDL